MYFKSPNSVISYSARSLQQRKPSYSSQSNSRNRELKQGGSRLRSVTICKLKRGFGVVRGCSGWNRDCFGVVPGLHDHRRSGGSSSLTRRYQPATAAASWGSWSSDDDGGEAGAGVTASRGGATAGSDSSGIPRLSSNGDDGAAATMEQRRRDSDEQRPATVEGDGESDDGDGDF
ncbi:uncharacterized protein LOC121771057 [Salvia splendens]|uniref:uncharacterized protein LOC121771057 n=1 Tax=Salvia splendens TaxID=180675 RepID=UPI001C2639D8|nr:uncharacterized protein LOC121771057 [Salvia splendens]